MELRVAGQTTRNGVWPDGGLAISRRAEMAGSRQQAGLDRQPGQNRGAWHEQPRATSSSMRRPETLLVVTSLCLCKAIRGGGGLRLTEVVLSVKRGPEEQADNSP